MELSKAGFPGRSAKPIVESAAADGKVQMSEATNGDKRTVTILPQTEREHYFNDLVDALVATGHMFARGDRIMTDLSGRLEQIDNASVCTRLVGRVVNIVKVDKNGRGMTIDPPVADAEFLMRSPIVRDRLLQIAYVTEVPALDDKLAIVSPGYNADGRIYYQGKPIQAIPTREKLDLLLNSICFMRPVDRSNFLGFLLTPFLGRRFPGGRPIAILRGNQPGIGKTAAGQMIALIHSADAKMLSVSYIANDIELEKCISGVVRQTNSVLVDNVKAPPGRVISSSAIERTITLPTYNFRRVGTSETITGPNHLQFIITYNGGEMATDLTSRSIFVMMEYGGDPTKRTLPSIGDPVEFVREHREEIVGELLGMVRAWLAQAHQDVPVACRFRPWAAMINGILHANGVKDFLSTHLQDARQDDELQVALVELANSVPDSPRRASEWTLECLRLNLFREHLRDRSQRGRQTFIGQMLRAACGREVIVPDPERPELVRVYCVERTEDRNGAQYCFRATTKESDTRTAAELHPDANQEVIIKDDGPPRNANGRSRSKAMAARYE